jgi:hypothetical protein
MHFLQRSTHFSKTCYSPLITSKFLTSELPFNGWKSPEIAWGEIWIEFCVRLGKSGSVEPHQNIRHTVQISPHVCMFCTCQRRRHKKRNKTRQTNKMQFRVLQICNLQFEVTIYRHITTWHSSLFWTFRSVPFRSAVCLSLSALDSYHQITSWSKVLLEQLIVAQLVKKFPTLYGTPRFIIMFTRVRYRAIPWASWIQSTLHFFKVHFNIILSSTSSSLKQLHPIKFSDYNITCTSHLPHWMFHALAISPLPFGHPNNTWRREKTMEPLITQFYPSSFQFFFVPFRHY